MHGDPVLMLRRRLTGRDVHLLDWLADHEVLTTFQIAHAPVRLPVGGPTAGVELVLAG